MSQTGDRATVLMVDANNKIADRKVTLGLQTSSDAEVSAGLREGDRIVVSDRSALKPGMAVKPQIAQLEQYQGGNDQ